ncbi:MAG: tRNA (guanosine(37)-N1)-methyltransferase TrmD [Clostridia bacterium]
MRLDFLTLFPEMFSVLDSSIFGRAVSLGIFETNIIDIRSFSKDKHKKCDDYPFGGGAGMLMSPQPVVDAVRSVKDASAHVIYLSPQGKVLTQQKVVELSKMEHLVFLCGHYEGIDQRAIDLVVDEEISIGDYVLTGGELPAMVLADAVVRYIPKVLDEQATVEESFVSGLLEAPQYTRPQVFEGISVPEILVNGNHEKIAEWKIEQGKLQTKNKRPDLLGEIK